LNARKQNAELRKRPQLQPQRLPILPKHKSRSAGTPAGHANTPQKQAKKTLNVVVEVCSAAGDSQTTRTPQRRRTLNPSATKQAKIAQAQEAAVHPAQTPEGRT
jgi:hypothetical protein